MQITLRKAAVLLSELGAIFNSVDVHSMSRVTLDQYTPVEDTIAKARGVILAGFNLKNDINATIFEIRKQVGQANSSSGIDDLLAELAFAEKSIVLASDLSGLPLVDNIDALKDRLQKNAALEAAGHGARYVQTGVTNEESINLANARLRELKREKQKLKDKLLDLNIQTKITLSDKAVALLRRKEVDLI